MFRSMPFRGEVFVRWFCISVFALAFSGCSSFSKREQLENVAKDWSMTIRASQIIPVYPLTEDLQPGDLFLVQVPVPDQQKVYEQKGFLPLDNHLDRLQPGAYPIFYSHSFLKGGTASVLPYDWLVTNDAGKAWAPAPNAVFPSYSFSVKRGGGFNLAVPVQGVPVGLSLMGGDAAQGSILITDAKSYGIDTLSLADAVEDWGRRHRDFLEHYAPRDKRQNYVRVVSRVYLTGRVNISMSSSKSGSGGLSAGAPKPVDVFSPSADPDLQKRVLGDYEANLEKLNSTIEEGLKKTDELGNLLPGATVKVVAASANSISLSETFPRPLVIGYLGFDMAIGPDGYLGPPIPTAALLSGSASIPNVAAVQGASLTHVYANLKTAAKTKDEKGKRANKFVGDLDALAVRILPDAEPCDIFHTPTPGMAAVSVKTKAGTAIDTRSVSPFSALVGYRARLNSSIAKIVEALADPKASAEGGAIPRSAADTQALEHALACDRQALSEINQALQARANLLHDAQVFATQIEYGE